MENKRSPFIAVDGTFSVDDIADLAKQYSTSPIEGRTFKIIEHLDNLENDGSRLNRRLAIEKIDQVQAVIKDHPLVNYVIKCGEVRRLFGVCLERQGFDVQLVNWSQTGMESLQGKMNKNNTIYGLFDKEYFDNMIFDESACFATKLLEVSKNFASYGGVVFDGGNKKVIQVIPQVSERIASGLLIPGNGMSNVLESIWQTDSLSVINQVKGPAPLKKGLTFINCIKKALLQGQYS